MVSFSQLALVLAAGSAAVPAVSACYFRISSSTVGSFGAQHSEPKDHGGAAQTFSFSKGGCTAKGQIFDGCKLSFSSTSGCGSVSYSVCPAERAC